MRHTRALYQERFDYKPDELLELENELIAAVHARNLSDRDKAIATGIIHNKLSLMRRYVRAQAWLEAEGDITCT